MIRLCAVLLWVALASLMSLVFEGAKLWVFLKPWKRFKAWRGRRKREKSAWAEHHLDEIAEDFNQTDEESPMALDLGTRTSTNTVVGTGFLGTAYVQLVGLLPYPDLVAALTTPQMVVVVTAVIAWAVARISKTPDSPGTL